MAYNEYRPHPLLYSCIECYWSVKTLVEKEQSIFPDGCTDIIFDFGEEHLITSVVGIMTRAVQVSGAHDAFGIRFRAGRMNSYVPGAMDAFTNESISINDVTNILPDSFHERMRVASNGERIRLVDHWLLTHMESGQRLTPWQWCVNQIQLQQGNISIRKLAKEAAMSERQLERKLLQHVGVTPKRLSTIMRFCAAKKRLDTKDLSLEQLAWDLGYTDHAHFTKSFRSFAGMSPSAYVTSI